ncbi:MAG: hypothetical protein HZA78_07660 [Candidatus Schekmanbacteria bacterium]|nr:hypothetical protein [Candidatus Schekmanbacteria bacterium]
MIVHITDQPINHVPCDGIILHLFAEKRPPRGTAGAVDWLLNGFLSRYLQEERIRGKENEIVLLPTRNRLDAQKILIFGLGRPNAFNVADFKAVWQKAGQTLLNLNLFQLVIAIPILSAKYPHPEGSTLASAMIGGLLEGIKKSGGDTKLFQVYLTDFSELKTKQIKNTFREQIAALPGIQAIGF